MSELMDFVNSLNNFANTGINIAKDYISEEAKLSTQSKQIKLQADINNKLMQIKQSGSYDTWQDDMTTFFEQIKNGMSDKNSVYYCANNLQAQQFEAILDQNQVNVSDTVNKMVFSAKRDKAIVDYNNNLALIAELYTGPDYVAKANEGAKLLYDNGFIDQQQLQNQYDNNYKNAYTDMRTKAFNARLLDALAQNKTFAGLYNDIENNMPELVATDTAGLPKSIDKTALDASVKKTLEQNYNAVKADIQYANANKLSEIVQEMRQETTVEGKLAVARRGQLEMDKMLGLQLSESSRNNYSKLFEYEIKSLTAGGSGSGSGSSKSTEEFEKYIKAGGVQAFQWVLDGNLENSYDSINVMSDVLEELWMNKDFKENYLKDAQERATDYQLLYSGRTSVDALTTKVLDELKSKFPTAAYWLDNDCEKLISDIEKHPDKYGSASVGELSSWMMDTLLGSDKNYTNDQFEQDLKDRINNCYVEKCKYVELNDKGNLKAKFNASDPSQIAQAARVAGNDYVFNYQGKEYWAEGTKEALEAEGGVVNVLQSAVRSTLNIPENVEIPYQFKTDEQHNDVTSTPIFTYNNQNYQVVPNDDDDGFKLAVIKPGTETREINNKIYEVVTDRNGNRTLQEVEYIDGKVKDYSSERKAEKKQKKIDQQTAHDKRTTEEDKRISEIDSKMTTATTMPKAMQAVWGADNEQWKKTQNTSDARQTFFHDTEAAIEKDAKKVKKYLSGNTGKNSMLPAKFREKYNINYYDWAKSEDSYTHYNLILNSN